VELIQTYSKAIHALCATYQVRSLFAFGSVTRNELKPESDIDLVVDIDTLDPLAYSDNYFNLKFHLEHILKRNIDLLEMKAIKNPILKQNIDNSKILVYGKGY